MTPTKSAQVDGDEIDATRLGVRGPDLIDVVDR